MIETEEQKAKAKKVFAIIAGVGLVIGGVYFANKNGMFDKKAEIETPTVTPITAEMRSTGPETEPETGSQDYQTEPETNKIVEISQQQPQWAGGTKGEKTFQVLEANGIIIEQSAQNGSWTIQIPERSLSTAIEPYFTKDHNLKITLLQGKEIKAEKTYE